LERLFLPTIEEALQKAGASRVGMANIIGIKNNAVLSSLRFNQSIALSLNVIH
jgi:hypothetical protein